MQTIPTESMDYEGIELSEQMRKWKYFLHKIVILKKNSVSKNQEEIQYTEFKTQFGGRRAFRLLP